MDTNTETLKDKISSSLRTAVMLASDRSKTPISEAVVGIEKLVAAQIESQLAKVRSEAFAEAEAAISGLRVKHGNAAGSAYEEGVWDHGHRCEAVLRKLRATAAEVGEIGRATEKEEAL